MLLYFVVFVLSVVLAVFFTLVVENISKRFKIVDKPKNKRKIHK